MALALTPEELLKALVSLLSVEQTADGRPCLVVQGPIVTPAVLLTECDEAGTMVRTRCLHSAGTDSFGVDSPIAAVSMAATSDAITRGAR